MKAVASNLFRELKGRQYDLIVSNPPYVPAARWKAMPAEYHHEPALALKAGSDGMSVVDRILNSAADFLADGGVLVCDVGGSVPEFTARFPDLPVIWPEFEQGGDGVFVVTKDELRGWKEQNVR